MVFFQGTVVAAYAPTASGKSKENYTKAIKAASEENYKQAYEIAKLTRDAKLIKIIEWMRLTNTKNIASFDDLNNFMKKNKNWPRIYLVRRNAEKALLLEENKAELEKWFKDYPPVSVEAVLAYTDILMARKDWEAAIPLLHNLWIKSDLTEQELELVQERLFLILNEQDYADRLKQLLWARKTAPAKKILPLVDEETRKLAEARIALTENAKNIRKKIKEVPSSLQTDPGLVFDQLRWARRNKKFDDAIKLLRHKSAGKEEKGKWWAERAAIIRHLLNTGKKEEAYKLARDHRLSKGGDYADAEWLAGWIALRSLKNIKEADYHFNRMLEAVRSPVSVSRGEYWLGRTHEELGKKADAEQWYQKAAEKSTTIYGQLAAGKISRLPDLPKDQDPSKEIIARIRRTELFAVMKILQDAGEYDLAELFALRLHSQFNKPNEIIALAHVLSEDISRPDLAVNLARRARQNGIHLVSLGYPVMTLNQELEAEQAIVLSIIRQESNFSSHVVSPAGARGLMQIMPATAKQVAQKKKKKFDPQMLNSNPEFNVEVGSAYFSELLKRFDGSYILALAAYNAGPTNVRRWLKSIGTPGTENIDPIDWIEMIPFNETRNYVLRVLENLHIYRRHLNYPVTTLNMWSQENG